MEADDWLCSPLKQTDVKCSRVCASMLLTSKCWEHSFTLFQDNLEYCRILCLCPGAVQSMSVCDEQHWFSMKLLRVVVFLFFLQINLSTFLQQFQLKFLTRRQSACIQNYSVQWSLLCRPGGVLLRVGSDGDGALVDLHVQADPVSSSHLQGLLQHRRRLLPVRVVAQGADAVFRVQVDVVPERDRRDSPCMCGLDLEERDQSSVFCGHISTSNVFQCATCKNSSLKIYNVAAFNENVGFI